MLSTFFLLTISFGAIGKVFSTGAIFPWAEIIGLLGFVTLEFTRLSRMAQTLLVLCVALPVYGLATNSFDTSLFWTAMHRAAFMAFFLTSLSFLQFSAGRSPLVQRSGKILVNQAPGRRYLVLTFGSAVFGLLLNLGTVGLLGTMIARGVAPGKDAEEERIANIRKKRMTLAMMRGFCALPMWSPITVTIAIVLAALPNVSWAQMVVKSAPMAVLFLLIGWAMDRRAYPKRPSTPLPEVPSLTGLLPLLTITILVPATAYLASKILQTNLITALLICLPMITVSWLAIQEYADGPSKALRQTVTLMRTGLLPNLPEMRTEITLFSTSVFIGVIVAATIDTETLGHTILSLGLSGTVLLILAAWFVVGLSMFGISPIITVTILVSTLPKLGALQIDPVALGITMLTAWTISVGISPFSAAVRFSGRMIDENPTKVGISWNLGYTLALLVVLSGFLLVSQ